MKCEVFNYCLTKEGCIEKEIKYFKNYKFKTIRELKKRGFKMKILEIKEIDESITCLTCELRNYCEKNKAVSESKMNVCVRIATRFLNKKAMKKYEYFIYRPTKILGKRRF